MSIHELDAGPQSIGALAAGMVNRLAEKTGRVRQFPESVERIPITDRDAWLAGRSKTINASEVAAVFGISPFMTPLALYSAKVNGRAEIDSKVMQRGRWLEAAAFNALQDERPEWECKPCDYFLRDVSRRIGATPDAINIHGEPVEVKAPTGGVFRSEWSDGPPLQYQLQALQQAILMDAPRAWLAALVVDGYSASLQVYEVPRHAEAEARLLDGVRAFWERIVRQDPPPATFGADANTLAALYPRESGAEALDLSTDNHLPGLLAERRDLMARKGLDEKRLDEINDEIKAKLGEAAEARLPGWKLSWKTQSRREVVTPAKAFRVLRVSEVQT